MIKEYKNSRFYPCPLAANGDWCGGIVALTGHLYECTRWLYRDYKRQYKNMESGQDD